MGDTAPAHIIIGCEYCEKEHRADYSHEGRFGEGPIFTAVCTGGEVWYEDNYTLVSALTDSKGSYRE